MKETGVEWIGDTPEHWVTKRLKFNTIIKGRVGWQALTSDEFIEEGPYCVTGTDFDNGKINWKTCYHISTERYEMDTNIQLLENDLLITKDGTIGKIAVVRDVPGKACLNSGVFVIRPKNDDYLISFMYYILKSKVFHEFIQHKKIGSTILHLYQYEFKEMPYPQPPLIEQERIASFLEQRTSKLNQLITKKQRLVELLQEKRQALITQAVTKGLDPTVPMKDSGVEWLGKVPDYWDVTRLRFLSKIETGSKDTQDQNPEGKYPFFVRSDVIEHIDEYTHETEAVMTAGDGVGVGRVYHYFNGKFAVHQRVYAFYDFKGITGKFLYYYMKANFANQVLRYNAKSTVDSLRRYMLLDFQISVPPIKKQLSIIDYIESETSKIDQLVAKLVNQIELIEEYRQTLITNAVTGGIDVRGEGNDAN